MKQVSRHTLERLPMYLRYLTMTEKEDIKYISSPIMAKALNLNQVQVRKDLALISTVGGKPKQGYEIDRLIADIKNFLGYDEVDKAVLLGAGNLGRALLAHKGYADYGLDIIAAFDQDEKVIGKKVNGRPIYSIDKLKDFCKKEQVKIGIITVGYGNAQSACDSLVDAGIQGIWSFSQEHLVVPDDILVQYENTGASLAILSIHLREKMSKEK